MHPLRNTLFGNASGKIAVKYHNGSSVVNGYIVKQTGTRSFIVTTDGTTTYPIKLASTQSAVNSLTAGLGTIEIYPVSVGTSAVFSPVYAVNAVSIVSGGSGYSVGNTLTVTGGTGTAAVFTVSTVSSGAITGLTFSGAAGQYTVLPGTLAAPNRTLAYTATGANATATIAANFTIYALGVGTAGSGYTIGERLVFNGIGATTTPVATITALTGSGVLTVTVSVTGVFHTAPSSITVTGRTENVLNIQTKTVTTIQSAVKYPWVLSGATAGQAQIAVI